MTVAACAYGQHGSAWRVVYLHLDPLVAARAVDALLDARGLVRAQGRLPGPQQRRPTRARMEPAVELHLSFAGSGVAEDDLQDWPSHAGRDQLRARPRA